MAPCRCFECHRTLVRREAAVGCWHRLSICLHRCSEGFPWWQYLWPVSINPTSCFLHAPYSEGRGARAAGATGFWTLWIAPELSPARSTEVKALENLLLRAKTRLKTQFWAEFLHAGAEAKAGAGLVGGGERVDERFGARAALGDGGGVVLAQHQGHRARVRDHERRR